MAYQLKDFAPGQEVNWLYEARGGWGFTRVVIAKVVRIGKARVVIEVHEKADRVWVRKEKAVKPEKLWPCEDLEKRAQVRRMFGL